jgi:hypothetical protein
MVQQDQHGAGATSAFPRGKKLFLGSVMFCPATTMALDALAIAGVHFVGGSLLARGAPP